MEKTVFCRHFKKDLPAMKKAPMPGALGQILLENVSEDAFNEWIEAQIKIINEERLDLSEDRAQRRLYQKMGEFLDITDLMPNL